MVQNNTFKQVDLFLSESKKLEVYYSKKLGCHIGTTELILRVVPLVGLKYGPLWDGSLVHHFSDLSKSIYVPFQICVGKVHELDPRFLERPPLTIQQEFPVGCGGFILSKKVFGAPIQIMSHNENSSMNCKLVKTEEPAIEKLLKSELNIAYTPSYIVAKELEIPNIVLSRITSDLYITTSLPNKNKVLIGLAWKSEKRKEAALGLVKKDMDNQNQIGWLYSQKAIQLLTQFKSKFGFILDYIKNTINISGMLKFADIFADDQLYQQLIDWKRDNGIDKVERVSWSSDTLDKSLVKKIEVICDEFYKSSSSEPKFMDVINVPRNAILMSNSIATPLRLKYQKFGLGDRFVNIQQHGNVPIAVKGTVIGLMDDWVEALFDDSFVGAENLDHRCSENRGLWLNKSAILNITNFQVFSDSPLPTDVPIKWQSDGYRNNYRS